MAVLELQRPPQASALRLAAEIDRAVDRSHIVDHRAGLQRRIKRRAIHLEETIALVLVGNLHLDRASVRGVLDIEECQMAIVAGEHPDAIEASTEAGLADVRRERPASNLEPFRNDGAVDRGAEQTVPEQQAGAEKDAKTDNNQHDPDMRVRRFSAAVRPIIEIHFSHAPREDLPDRDAKPDWIAVTTNCGFFPVAHLLQAVVAYVCSDTLVIQPLSVIASEAKQSRILTWIQSGLLRRFRSSQ
jgi:hypothetical protein